MTLMDRLRGISAPDETMPDMEAPWKRTRSLDDLEPTEMLSPSIDPDALLLNMKKLEQDLNRNRLDEIAQLVRALTYGEMMELAAGLWKATGCSRDANECGRAYADCAKCHGSEPVDFITAETLPKILHKWSGERQ